MPATRPDHTCRLKHATHFHGPAKVRALLLGMGLALLLTQPAHVARAAAQDPNLQAMEWREIGPYRGGRSAAVAGIPGDPNTYYFGACGGGVWKTTDAGRTWDPVSDGYFGGSIGAVAVSAWDPNVVYAGGGEKTVRGNVSHGDGMWKSTDAGQTWSFAGLEDSRHISRVRIHPRDANQVYAAVMGHLFGPSEARGVYRSRDGGSNWERVLFTNERAGAVDLAMDPTNPRILYASLWNVRRTPHSLESGGSGSGLWKSTDGGDNWKELTANEGLPTGIWGISGISVSAADPRNLYAIIEAEEGGVFRSRDGGDTWTRTNQERKLRQRAWYYSRLVADPVDTEKVYVLNVRFHRSVDGGRTFSAIDVPHGDNHDLWIDPGNPQRMIEANDGGANVSFDGGATWSRQDNQPTAQFYRVTTDNHFPYRIYGAQQDNTTVRILHRAPGGAIDFRHWEPTAGGESGHIAVHPDNPDIVYGGSYGGTLTRINHATGERRAVNVWPDNPMGWGAAELRYRFQWNFPLFFSPHDSSTLYAAGNVLFRSRDEGHSWQAISPDLTRNDKSTQQPSGGPITRDNTGVEYYATIFAALESPHEAGVLWAGSDDGMVHLSRDGGATWNDVTPKGLPQWMMINSMEAHPFVPGGLYLAATRYKLDDFSPYLYRTTDYGKTWNRIDRGIPRQHFTRVIRADRRSRGLLYAGTERGVYTSDDDGANWRSLQLNLPLVPITDMALKEDDLVVATQGRGFWVLDDLSALQQMTASVPEAPHLFAPRAAWRLGDGGRRERPGVGTNPNPGISLYYLLPEVDEAVDVRLEVLQADGLLIKAWEGQLAPAAATAGAATGETDTQEAEDSRSPAQPGKLKELKSGLNRFTWDLRYPGPESFDGMILWAGMRSGPMAVPGNYRLRLLFGDDERQAVAVVRPDPRSQVDAAGLRAQFDFLITVRDKLTETHRGISTIRGLRSQLDELLPRVQESTGDASLEEEIEALRTELDAIEESLYQTRNKARQDPLNYPIRLNNKLSSLAATVGVGSYPPTTQAEAVRLELTAAIDEQLQRLAQVKDVSLPLLNQRIHHAQVPAVVAPATGNPEP